MPARKRLPEEDRKNEILNACERLYETKGFREITIKDISTETSFSRPSIYNYFETKEEIFLGLLTKEYEQWILDLNNIADSKSAESPAILAKAIGKSLEKRKTLLKITSMNLYEIEGSSRLERLMEFKRQFKLSTDAFVKCVKQASPDISKSKITTIQYALFPFMFGIYPYAFPTEKQLEAMKREGFKHKNVTIRQMVEKLLKNILD